MSWTEERLAECKRLHDMGYSASKIAEALGGDVSRNAVIGIIHRKGWARSSRTVVRNPWGRRGLRRRSPRRAAKPGVARQSTPAQRAAAQTNYLNASEATDLPIDVSSFACTLLDLTEKTCRWPLGDPGTPDFRFCGAPKPFEQSYCVRHHAIAYRPPQSRMNLSAAEIERRRQQARSNYQQGRNATAKAAMTPDV
jgi:GcrA cell cycle regulator